MLVSLQPCGQCVHATNSKPARAFLKSQTNNALMWFQGTVQKFDSWVGNCVY
ncbi:rCG49507 [Rattus norvegicus]|uniref:RCG49507 n=1 Tax=Rattus norvegicus TaxID=10116 RepID=A6J3E6_RAT|nr:rCG49507 [Rattus norvegicus]